VREAHDRFRNTVESGHQVLAAFHHELFDTLRDALAE